MSRGGVRRRKRLLYYKEERVGQSALEGGTRYGRKEKKVFTHKLSIITKAKFSIFAGGPMKKDAKDLAWELFEKTGSIAYYNLYKKLSDKDEKR